MVNTLSLFFFLSIKNLTEYFFSSEQISKTGNLDANLILRQNKLDLMSRFMELKSINPKLGQDQIAKEVSYSCSTLQRYRHDIKMQSPYKPNGPKRTPSNDPKRFNWLNPSQMKLMRSLRVTLALRLNLLIKKVN